MEQPSFFLGICGIVGISGALGIFGIVGTFGICGTFGMFGIFGMFGTFGIFGIFGIWPGWPGCGAWFVCGAGLLPPPFCSFAKQASFILIVHSFNPTWRAQFNHTFTCKPIHIHREHTQDNRTKQPGKAPNTYVLLGKKEGASGEVRKDFRFLGLAVLHATRISTLHHAGKISLLLSFFSLPTFILIGLNPQKSKNEVFAVQK